MNFDISLAGWLLALATFIAGTVIPIIYKKLLFEGLSITNALNDRLFINNESEDHFKLILVLKFANVTNSSVLIEEISPQLPKIGNQAYKVVDVVTYDAQDDSIFDLILVEQKKDLNSEHVSNKLSFYLNQLPFIVTKDEVSLITFTLKVTPIKSNKNALFHSFTNHVESHGLDVKMKVNQRYRKYTFNTHNSL